MKKTTGICLAAILCMIVSVTASADIQNKKTEPDYKTDYYMIVESKSGGIDIYANPDLEAAKLSEEMIPNGTALHIEGEVEDKAHKRIWGYVQYHGMNGFVPLDDCRPAASRQEAIDSELYLAGRENVDYEADYDIIVSEEDSIKLYQGPGEKYGTVPGVRDIKSGETLHITQDAHMDDGSYWGMTTVDGKQGWINLDEVQNPEKEEKCGSDGVTGGQKAADRGDKSVPSEEIKYSVTTVPIITEKPVESLSAVSEEREEPGTTDSETSEITEKPGDLPSADPETDKNPIISGAPESVSEGISEEVGTASGEQSTERTPASAKNPETAEVTGKSEKESENSRDKKEVSDKNKENSAEEKVQEASAQTVKTSSGIPAPFIWIAVIATGAVIGVFIYHFKNR